MSKRLRKLANSLRERRCPKPCGNSFVPKVWTQRHCSAKCRNRAAQAAWRRRQRELKRKPRVEFRISEAEAQHGPR